MAKKSMIEREKKRTKLIEKYADKREALLDEFRSAASPHPPPQPLLVDWSF
jgi:small subunit ribosomal protein S14